MYKVNTEKLTAHYAALAEQLVEVKATCEKESKQIAADRGYSADLTKKLTDFLYIEKYKNDKLDEQIAFLSGFVDNVDEVAEGMSNGETINQN